MAYEPNNPIPLRLFVSAPGGEEQLRRWAEAVAGLQQAGALIIWRAENYLPGEDIEEARAAWGADDTFKIIIQYLDPGSSEQASKVTLKHLAGAGLSDHRGNQKLSALRRALDHFLAYFWSEPSNSEKLRKACEAAEKHFELGSVALDSLGACAAEVPGFSAACKVGQEAALGLKYAVGLRGRREY